MTKQIKQEFVFHCGAESILNALTEEKHLRNWWTTEAVLRDGKGVFPFAGYGWSVELNIKKSLAQKSVSWKCTKSNMQNTNAWEGSTVTYKLIPDGTSTNVHFLHTKYKDSPCYDACSEGWSHFLGASLKKYLETGKGLPYSASGQ